MQYKLKERIEQLRGMDPSAFLSVDPGLFARDGEPAGEDADIASMDHLQAQAEGDRRKVVMLRVAETLEERYATLLNPDAHKALQGASFANSLDGFSQSGDGDEDDEEAADVSPDEEADETVEIEDDDDANDDEDDEDGPAATDASDDEEVDQLDEDVDVDIEEPEPPPPPQSHSTKLRIRLPPRGSLSVSNTPTPKPTSFSSTTTKKAGPRASFVQTTLSASAPSSNGTRKSSRTTRQRPISNGSNSIASPSGPSPPNKRQRLSEPASDHLPSPSLDWRNSKLYVFAAQSAPALAARKPVRHLVAFGVKLPEMPHEQEFEVPDFAWPESVPWEYVDDGEDDEAMVEEEVVLEQEGEGDVEVEHAAAPLEPVPATGSDRVLRHRPES